MGETPRPVDMNESHGMSAVTMRLNSPTNDKPACNLNWRQGEDLGSGMRLISSGIRLVRAFFSGAALLPSRCRMLCRSQPLAG